MRFILASLLVVLLICSSALAQLNTKVADRLWESATALDELVKGADAGIPKDLLKGADCVAVIPDAKKGALGLGGLYGKGAVSCRKDQGKGAFGSPSMISLGGGSFGFQIGGQAVDLVMLFMTPNSMQSLLKDKILLGGDAAATAGPVGRNASAETDATLHAEILTYAKSKGLFAGVSLKGSTLRPDGEANDSLYGKKVDAKELLLDGTVAVPEDAVKFVNALTKASATN
jgi:lipid-binding SYLF domain-containing protein